MPGIFRAIGDELANRFNQKDTSSVNLFLLKNTLIVKAVCTENLNTDVVMMKSAEERV